MQAIIKAHLQHARALNFQDFLRRDKTLIEKIEKYEKKKCKIFYYTRIFKKINTKRER